MKATDLMINDLVQVDGVVRIATIRTGAVYDYVNKEYSIGCIKPIPLTTKILEKNGWLFNDLPMCQDWEKDGIFIQENDGIHRTISMGINVSISVQYVHQLQHALRLCGFETLADNFKI